MLPYQQNVLDQILNIIPIQGLRILEIGGTPNWEVASHLIELGARSVTSINYRKDLGDLVISDQIEFRNLDARLMSSSLHGPYDLILGIAVLEHLPGLDIILSEAASLLHRDGLMVLHGAAFWSSKWGHHVYVHIDGKRYEFNSSNNPITDWSHLYLTQAEMCHELEKTNGLPKSHAEAICDYIYTNPILNRFRYEDIITSYARSNHSIEHLIRKSFGKIPSSTLQKIRERQPDYVSDIYLDHETFEMTIISRPLGE